MIHLYNRVYIEYDKLYTSKYNHTVLSLEEKPHPISEQLGEQFGQCEIFSEHIKTKHNNSIETFWINILSDVNNKSVLYCDDELYFNLTIQFWKSVFAEETPEFIYKLYCFYMQDNKLKDWTRLEQFNMMVTPFHESKAILDYASFCERYEKIVPVEILKKFPKHGLSFEFLLADCFLNPESIYKPVFNQRLKKICWRTWISDVLRLKHDIIANSFFLHKEFNVPKFELGQNNISILKENPELQWMFDPYFNADNSDYILKNYNSEIFLNCYRKFMKIIGQDADSFGFSRMTTEIFNENYFKLLEDNINSQSACIFIQEHLKNESNQLLASWFYKNIYEKNHDELRKFRLR